MISLECLAVMKVPHVVVGISALLFTLRGGFGLGIQIRWYRAIEKYVSAPLGVSTPFLSRQARQCVNATSYAGSKSLSNLQSDDTDKWSQSYQGGSLT